jgi:CheY-like chemotaxis protein
MNEIAFENRRVMVVDDNPDIHDDFRRILAPRNDRDATGSDGQRMVFGSQGIDTDDMPGFEVDSACQGEEAISMVLQAEEMGRPYVGAFVDVRMPPGIDGLETSAQIWKIAPHMHIVLCSGFSERSFLQRMRTLHRGDQLLILKKPFEPIEVYQLVSSMAKKWTHARMLDEKLMRMEQILSARNEQLSAAYQQAQQSQSTDSHLLASLSGEIREPLSTIVSFAASLRGDGQFQQAFPHRSQSIDSILSTGRELLEISDRILELCQRRPETLERIETV